MPKTVWSSIKKQQLAMFVTVKRCHLSTPCVGLVDLVNKNMPVFRKALPIRSMYGIFTYIYHKFKPHVGKYTIHGWYGLVLATQVLAKRTLGSEYYADTQSPIMKRIGREVCLWW